MRKNYDIATETKFGKSQVNPIKKVFNDFLNLIPKAKENLQKFELPEQWREVMGDAVANRTSEITVFRDMLFVKIESACMKNDLVHQREEILKKMQKYIPKLKTIFWK
jgi:hypothetical protein